MQFPLTPNDLSLWLAVTAILLLITSELLTAPTNYSRNITIERKKLRLTALAVGAAFMITVIIRIFHPF